MQYTKLSSGCMWDPTDLQYVGSKVKLYIINGGHIVIVRI
jgi:hypothetical protein